MSDFVMPEFIRESYPRARKGHQCDECRSAICVGERYRYVAGMWDGEFAVFKICDGCEALRFWMAEQDEPSPFGGLFEVFHDSGLDDEIPPLLLIAMYAR